MLKGGVIQMKFSDVGNHPGIGPCIKEQYAIVKKWASKKIKPDEEGTYTARPSDGLPADIKIETQTEQDRVITSTSARYPKEGHFDNNPDTPDELVVKEYITSTSYKRGWFSNKKETSLTSDRTIKFNELPDGTLTREEEIKLIGGESNAPITNKIKIDKNGNLIEASGQLLDIEG